MSSRALVPSLSVALLAACASVGPSSLANGRATYNAVINETEDQQILSMIVRHRYDESFGMLAVSSVTASLRVGASAHASLGVGPERAYEGNLVPLAFGATYEENPVISYVPMRGEEFVQRMLAPITAEQALLLARMSTAEVEVLRILVRRANGLANPLFSRSAADDEAFERFVALYARLRDRGELDVLATADGGFQMLLHDWDEDSDEVVELLDTLGIPAVPDAEGAIAVPLRFFIGTARGGGLDLETPSPLEVIEAAGSGVEVPADHVTAGLVRPRPASADAAFLRIRSSRDRPANASVSVWHRGWWFFVEASDAPSKQSFVVLRTLIGLRLHEASGQEAPVLTVPVGR